MNDTRMTLTTALKRAEPYGLAIAQNRGIFPSCEVPAKKFLPKTIKQKKKTL